MKNYSRVLRWQSLENIDLLKLASEASQEILGKNCVFNHKIWANSEIRTFALPKSGGGAQTHLCPPPCPPLLLRPWNTYSRDLSAWWILMNFIYVYVWEHRVSLNYRWWIFTKLGRDKVLMTAAHLYWLLGQIYPRMDSGQGQNRSRVPLLRRTSSSEFGGYSNKPNV